MGGLILAVLGFAGGGSLVYFLMDAPRRRGVAMAVRVELDEVRVAETLRAARETERKSDARAASLSVAEVELAGWRQEFAARQAEFDRRAVSYDDLNAENALLKTELRVAAVSAARQNFRFADSDSVVKAATHDRDRLGRAYFDEVAAAAKKAVTPANLAVCVGKIAAAAAVVRDAGGTLPAAEEAAAANAVQAQYEKAVRAGIERDKQAELREQMREERRQEAEAEAARVAAEKAEAERRAIEQALADAVAVAVADVSGRHESEVEQLRAALAEAEEKSRRATSLAQITRCGHVYVISNRGAFGPDVFKIGMTRRLVPQDRVDELGDASVPFPFDVHMMITTDDAPSLEKKLHHEFHHRRLNRVNLRKEFFRVSVTEVAAAVGRFVGAEVKHVADAEALKYEQSLKTTDDQLDRLELLYDRIAPAATADE